MLWIVFGCMLLAAVMIVAWPQYREERQLTVRSALAIVSVLVVSAVIYAQIGKPYTEQAVANNQNVDEMITTLAQRLQSEPDDLDGWKMLARSYGQIKRYPEAIAAYQKAAELESYSNGQTLVDLAESMLLNDDDAIRGQAGKIFEDALALSPRNPKALFYGGIAAFEKGDALVAADRWELLLATSPPVEIEGMLRQRINEWRGVTSSAAPVAATVSDGKAISINITLAASARESLDADATVFIIARDPAQPAPPIAVTRRVVSELPVRVTLSDADSMIPGRSISGFENIEIIVRVSASGQPSAQTGDWFASQTIDTTKVSDIELNIDQQVP